MTLDEFQDRIGSQFLAKDRARGLAGTYMWFMEEVGELAAALREGTPRDLEGEFADVLAWLASLANLAGVRLEDAAAKYAAGCPRCRAAPCVCRGEKP